MLRRCCTSKTRKYAWMSDLLRSTWQAAALGLVIAGVRDSCSGYAGFRPWLLSTGPPPGKRKNARRSATYARFCILPGWQPCWALSLLESGIAVPAMLVSSLACLFMWGWSLSLFPFLFLLRCLLVEDHFTVHQKVYSSSPTHVGEFVPLQTSFLNISVGRV